MGLVMMNWAAELIRHKKRRKRRNDPGKETDTKLGAPFQNKRLGAPKRVECPPPLPAKMCDTVVASCASCPTERSRAEALSEEVARLRTEAAQAAQAALDKEAELRWNKNVPSLLYVEELLLSEIDARPRG